MNERGDDGGISLFSIIFILIVVGPMIITYLNENLEVPVVVQITGVPPSLVVSDVNKVNDVNVVEKIEVVIEEKYEINN